MNSNLSVDRLSSLPKNVIENILMCMPIRDAVRTSTLARGWRYEWSTLPKVVIDMKSFLVTRRTSQMQLDRKIVKAVDHILLLHRGPIHKFTLFVDLKSRNDIDRWILFLSRNGVKGLVLHGLRGQIYKLPSCFFSCDMTFFHLYRCVFIPPTSFKGFSRLRVMGLQFVSFTKNGLANLLSLCPLLNTLVLSHITGCTRIKISGQKLVKINIEGAFDDIHFESTPILAFATINLLEVSGGSSVESNCRVVKVHGETPKIYKLELLGPTLQNLFVGDVPLLLPEICRVKDLLVDINFEDMQEMLTAFCIFRSSVVMQKLRITASSDDENYVGISSDGFWVAHESFNCTFSSLRVVEMTNVSGITSELKFIEFVLATAPVLEKMHIKFGRIVAGWLKILGELMRYPRISPKAKLFAPV